MKFKENRLVGGGGNSLKPSHNQDFSLIEAFNNLAPWGENKFVSEQKRTYKFKRGANNEPSPEFLTDKVNSLFTTHHSLINNDTDFSSRFTSHFSLKSAFTLAEVLITLGIIGVVAAMTIPTLIGNYKFSVLNNQLKTVYSDLNQAATLFKVHNEISVSEYAASTNETSALDLFSKEYTTVLNRNNMNADTKDEDGNRIEPYETHSINGKSVGALFCDASYYMYDPQGRIISFDNKPSGYENGPKVCIDINGLKKPNRIGQDIFIFVFTVDGHVIPFGQQHANNSAVGWIYGNGSIENKEDYCVYSSNSSKQMACANYALINQHPHTAGKDYWHDFVNGK